MDTKIALASLVITLLGFLYTIILGDRTLKEAFDAIKKRDARDIRRILVNSLVLVTSLGTIFLVFHFLIDPNIVSIKWEPVGGTADASGGMQGEEKIVINQDPQANLFPSNSVISTNTFPTTVRFDLKEKERVYVGTQSEGLLSLDHFLTGSNNWKRLGLKNYFITQIIPDPQNSANLLAATNLGIFTTSDGGATWEQKAFRNVLVTALERSQFDSNLLLAGTTKGLFRSQDNGETWVDIPEIHEAITSITFDQTNGRILYAGCLYGSIYRSEDSGRSWKQIREKDKGGFAPIAVDPNNPNTILIGPSQSGIYRSSDGGAKWEYLGLKGISIVKIIISNAPGTIFAASDDEKGVFVSTNNGESWRNWGMLRDQVIDLAEYTSGKASVLFVTTVNNGLLKSNDSGRTWQPVGFQRPQIKERVALRSITASTEDENHLYGVGYMQSSGLYESFDGGRSWSTAVGNIFLQKETLLSFYQNPYSPKQLFISGQVGRIIQSDDAGKSWQDVAQNLPRYGYAPVVVSNKGVIFAAPGNSGVWKKTGQSSEWVQTGLNTGFIEKIYILQDHPVLMAIDSQQNAYLSTDEGETWRILQEKFYELAFVSTTGKIIGVSLSGSILSSNDFGKSWNPVSNVEIRDTDYYSVTVQMDERNNIYIYLGNSILFSDDQGETWAKFSLPESGQLTIGKNAHLYFLGTSDALFESLNYGRNWSPIIYPHTMTGFTSFAELNQVVIAGTNTDGIFVSKNSGETWNQTSIGSGVHVFSLWADPSPEKKEVLALVSVQGKVSLLRSYDAQVWNEITSPCEYSSSYFEEINSSRGIQWQFACVSSNQLVVFHPQESTSWLKLNLPEDAANVADALYGENGSVFILANDYMLKDKNLWAKMDDRGSWKHLGPIQEARSVKLATDTRQKGILLEYNDQILLAEYAPNVTKPLSVPFTMAILLVLVGFAATNANYWKTLLSDNVLSLYWVYPSSRFFRVHVPILKKYQDPYPLIGFSIVLISLCFVVLQLLPPVHPLLHVFSTSELFNKELEVFIHLFGDALNAYFASQSIPFVVFVAITLFGLLMYSLLIYTAGVLRKTSPNSTTLFAGAVSVYSIWLFLFVILGTVLAYTSFFFPIFWFAMIIFGPNVIYRAASAGTKTQIKEVFGVYLTLSTLLFLGMSLLVSSTNLLGAQTPRAIDWMINAMFLNLLVHGAYIFNEYRIEKGAKRPAIIDESMKYGWFLDCTSGKNFSIDDYPINRKQGVALCRKHGMQLQNTHCVEYDPIATKEFPPTKCWLCDD